MTSQPVENKVALITGANKGIGLEIARQLGVQGITVLIGARDEKRGQEAADKLNAEHNIDARAVQLDVTDNSTIEAAAKHIESEFGKLDILVNNAGIALDRIPPSQLDIEVLRRTYDTNFFGVFAVIKAMLPLLRKSEAGRIVNMSSGLASLAQNTDPNYEYAQMKLLAYNSSKTALNAMTIQFAHELKDTPIKVNSADPGYVATDINANSGPRTVEQGATAPVRLATLPSDGPTGGFFDENGVVPW
ncbi:MAG: SDR family oxidoreductase [Hassallia sp. WJT32-NPBG1]|jgi:NAD(P)-dependent dehydrogenase (short-subunit alcohol dehydrogenase family)|nr:SDR family oxidoreductase [Hassallia sp. WJT32-NPBG1]